MSEFFKNKLFRFLPIFLLFQSNITYVRASSALAAWSLNSNGTLELRTRSNSKLKAYFQKANKIYGEKILQLGPCCIVLNRVFISGVCSGLKNSFNKL